MLMFPVARVKPSAIMPALYSCAQSQNLMPAAGNKSEMGIIAEPMMPNAWWILCFCKTFMKASSVVILILPPAWLEKPLELTMNLDAQSGIPPRA